MASVLALDMAPGVTGYCFGDLSSKLPSKHGFWRMPNIGGEGAIYTAFANVLWDSIEELQPTALVIENPLPPQAQTDTSTAFKIYAMRGYCLEACNRHSVAFAGVGANDVRVGLLGRCRWPGGSAEGKKAIVRHVRSLGLPVSDHNEADAIMVWLFWRAEMIRAESGRDPMFRDAAD
jgi:Holliday junction resolvasome RuvABC endonuclease subunit